MSETPGYVSGGYFLTKLFRRAEWMSPDLVPEAGVSVSTCITEVFPRSLYTNEEPHQWNIDLAKLGVPEERFEEMVAWIEAHPPQPGDLWPYAFSGVEGARDFARQFMPAADDIVLVGVSLHPSLVGKLLEDAEGSWVSELTEVVKLGMSPATAGEFLGYEVLGHGVAGGHTLICTGGEKDVFREFGIRLNRDGLIADYAEGLRAAQWASTEGNAEPGVYLPWKLARYGW